VNRAYLALLAVSAADATGYGVIAPVLPAISRTTHAGPGLIGVLVSALGLGAVVGYALAGPGIQRFGASAVLVASLLLAGVGTLGFIVSHSLAVYVVARVLQGVGSGGIWIGATVAVIERFPGEEYRRLTGVLGAYSVGTILGPVLGAAGGIRPPFAIYLALLVPAGVAAALVRAPGGARPVGSDRAALVRPGFRLASAAILMAALALGTFEGPLPLHFGVRLSQAEIGALFAASSVVVGAFSVAAGRLRPVVALWVGAPLLVGGIAMAGATNGVVPWIVTVGVASVGFGLTEAGSMGVLLEGVGRSGIVLAVVVWSQLWAGGYLVGPAAAGVVVQALGYAAVGLVPLAGLVLVLAAAIPARGSHP
jgi:predicted MFS family arabinose efflux permease